MPAADFPGRTNTPARTPARARPTIDPALRARLREMQFKALDIADGILDKLKAGQTEPASPPLPLIVARRQMVNILGVPSLCERGRCRRSKLCTGEPAHCLTVHLHALPHEMLARVLSRKAMRQRVRKRSSL
jgi:hypothetical protein